MNGYASFKGRCAPRFAPRLAPLLAPRLAPLLLLVLILVLGGCADAAETHIGSVVEHDTIGDTIIVRTVSGSSWQAEGRLEPEVQIGVFDGEEHFMFGDLVSLAVAPDGSIYVVDRQAMALRKFGVDGSYLGTFGREGAGPGEYSGPDGGLGVLPDGRVVIRDPANARMQVFAADGEPFTTWPVRSGFNTSNPIVVDTAGYVYSQVLMDPEAGITEWKMGLVALDPETGEAVDTIPAPEWDFETPRLTASREGSTSITSLPFSPSSSWVMSPLGYMIGGLSTRYAIDLYRDDGTVLQIQRASNAIPVQAGEKANRREQTIWNMRQTEPGWSWSGPAIPDSKPPFRRVFAGQDGRIWVLLNQEAEAIADEDVVESTEPNARPATRWTEPVVFDVFEPDGTYLGAVRAPDGFSIYPAPVFDGDQVWGVVRDEFDVQYITRLRVSFEGGGAV